MFNLYTLDNGLRVVTEYIEHVNSISVGIMVQNGSRMNQKMRMVYHTLLNICFSRAQKKEVQKK